MWYKRVGYIRNLKEKKNINTNDFNKANNNLNRDFDLEHLVRKYKIDIELDNDL